MTDLPYLSGYPAQLTDQIRTLLSQNRLADLLLKRYPVPHDITTDRALYDFAMELKNQYLRKAPPLSKVLYDKQIRIVHDALGLQTSISRIQGAKLKNKNEIRIGSALKTAPLPLLRMLVVHELAHLKEKAHDKAFYKLCEHMEASYHQLEFDLRVYLTYTERCGSLYG